MGCYRNFSASGYTSHVTRTLNKVCRAVYHTQLRSLQDDDFEDFDDDLGVQHHVNFNDDFDDDLGALQCDDSTWEDLDGIDCHHFGHEFSAGGRLFRTRSFAAKYL